MQQKTIGDHELSVLAHLLTFTGEIDRKGLVADNFTPGLPRLIFSTINKLYRDFDELPGREKLIQKLTEVCDDPLYELQEAEDWAFNFHLEHMKSDKVKRSISELAEAAQDMTLDDLNLKMKKMLPDTTLRKKSESASLKNSQDDFAKELELRRQKQESGGVGLITGYPTIDHKICMQNGQLVLLAARPSVGKSALALNLAVGAAMLGSRVMYVTLEMSKHELMNRAYSYLSQENLTKFKYGNVSQEVLNIVNGDLDSMLGDIQIEYMPGAKTDDILYLAESREFDVLVIDHVDLIRDRIGRGETEASAIGKMTASLKAFAGKHDVVVLALSQFNRESKGDFPKLHQLRGSGAKEQDADSVLILHRDLDSDTVEHRECLLRIAKNRSGETGDIPLRFTPETTTFTEL